MTAWGWGGKELKHLFHCLQYHWAHSQWKGNQERQLQGSKHTKRLRKWISRFILNIAGVSAQSTGWHRERDGDLFDLRVVSGPLINNKWRYREDELRRLILLVVRAQSNFIHPRVPNFSSRAINSHDSLHRCVQFILINAEPEPVSTRASK